jgi:hypothetical protein
MATLSEAVRGTTSHCIIQADRGTGKRRWLQDLFVPAFLGGYRIGELQNLGGLVFFLLLFERCRFC